MSTTVKDSPAVQSENLKDAKSVKRPGRLVHFGYFIVAIGILVLQFRAPQNLDIMVEWNEWLAVAKFNFPFISSTLIPSIPISLLDFNSSLMACRRYRTIVSKQGGQKAWIEILLSCTLLQFGGTSLTGMFLGQIPSWTLGNHVFIALLLAWWLTFFSPFDIYWNLTKNSTLFVFIVGIGSSLSAGHAIGSWGVDQAMYNALHNNSSKISRSIFVCLMCGTLSGSGGRLFNDLFGMMRKTNSFTITETPRLFQIGSDETKSVVNRSFILGLVYYCLINVHGFLPWRQIVTREVGHILLGLTQCLNFLLTQWDPEVDVFHEISTGLLRIINIRPIEFREGNEPFKEKKEK